MNPDDLLNRIPKNGILTIIERDLESNGDLFGLLLLKRVLEQDNTVFINTYDPLLGLKENLTKIGVDFERLLGKNLFIFDIFGSVYKIERDFEGVYQVKGYIDDTVFVDKFRELVFDVVKERKNNSEVWFFTYLSSSVCKLFSKPLRTYRLLLSIKHDIENLVENMKTVILYNSKECPEIEEVIYLCSDIVVETFFKDGQRIGIITKGHEEIAFELFGGR